MIEQKIIKQEEMEILRKLSIFFLMLANEFEPIELLLNKFTISMRNINYHNYKRNLVPMLKTGTIINAPAYQRVITTFIKELFTLSFDEKEFISSYNNGTFKPELIFNAELSEKAINHPMLLWKMKNFRKDNKE